MNNEKQPVKLAIKRYYAEKTLSDIQLQALQNTLQDYLPQSQNSINSKRFITLQRLASIAASLLLFVIVYGYAHTPSVITSAYADIQLDAGINNGLQASISQWMSENRIRNVPLQYPVEMSKRCHLDEYKTTHMRIAGYERGTMHLFLHRGNAMPWIKRTGTVGEMNWKLIKARDDLTVIVLYTRDMRESAIQNVLGEMFSELQV
jgi:hypothetical protein